jgi:hypothetical protein
MFGPEIRDKPTYPALHAAAERAFGLLVAAISEAQRAGYVRGGNPWDLAVSAWALAQGLSALLIDGQLKERVQNTREAEALASRVTKLLETGLARRCNRPAEVRPRSQGTSQASRRGVRHRASGQPRSSQD